MTDKDLLQYEETLTNEAGKESTSHLFDVMLSNNYHILVAGSTGAGKSVLINGFLNEYLKQEERGKIFIIDPKRIGFLPFKKCKAVKLLATKEEKFSAVLDCTLKIMNARYKYLESINEDTFNGEELLLIIDEFADLITEHKELQRKIIELLRLGRQAKIRVLLATQSPSRKVITAEIQQNCGLRIGLRTVSRIESVQVVSVKGCEDLPRYGQALVLQPGEPVTKYAVPYTDKTQLVETISKYK